MPLLSSILFPAVVLLFGVLIGTAVIRSGSQELAKTMIVPQPIVGGSGSQRQGPWPECLGKSGQDCLNLIETFAEDLKGHIQIIPYDSMVTMGFNPDRVRVFVDEDGVVQTTPSRG